MICASKKKQRHGCAALTSIHERIATGKQFGGGRIFAGKKRQGDGSIERDASSWRNRTAVTTAERRVNQVGWIGRLHLGIDVQIFGTASS